jgi:hypothetical protein
VQSLVSLARQLEQLLSRFQVAEEAARPSELRPVLVPSGPRRAAVS